MSTIAPSPLSEPAARPQPSFAEQRLLERIAACALDEARANGADKAAVALSTTASQRVDLFRAEVDKVQRTVRSVVVMSVLKGHRHGRAKVACFNEQDVREGARAACRIADFSQPDPHADLPDPSLHPTRFDDLGIWSPSSESMDAMADRLRRCAVEISHAAAGDQGLSRFGLETSACHSALATSAGFCGVESATMHAAFAEWMARDGRTAQKFFDSWSSRAPLYSRTLVTLGKSVRERASSLLGARPLRTGNYPVLLSSAVASFLFHGLFNALLPAACLQDKSFLRGRIGQPVMAPGTEVVDDPHRYGGLGSTRFDNDGVATGRTTIIENGVLRTWLLNDYAARRLGARSTGHASGVCNVRVEGPWDETELAPRLERGLYVIAVQGAPPNMMSGAFSLGASGYWVEHGRIQHAVEGVTVAGNLAELLRTAAIVGRAPRERPKITIGAVLVPSLPVGGT